MELNLLEREIKQIEEKILELRGIFEVDNKIKQVSELEKQMAQPDFWNDQEEAKKVSGEVSNLKDDIEIADKITAFHEELSAFLELLQLEEDEELAKEAEIKLGKTKSFLDKLELRLLLDSEEDKNDAILEIHSGAGGTESQDWAEMLLRMYLQWAKDQDYKSLLLDKQAGDVAGIKSVTIEIKGKNAYGFLKSESGVHRLVRISPFDSNHKRHTSFASVFVFPETNEEIEIEINESDLKIDTYHASGAGGQHVNTSDSAVRITHIPTGIVTQCQSERSQYTNKANAMKVLKARLLQKQKEEQDKERRKLENNKKKIEWGSQIRSYVFHPYSMVKDHRTEVKTGNVEAVMNGNIDLFIDAFLKMK
ncbi:MAG: peptide chain release factor 2 [Candidatus Cloacimonadota bacterium]|nr:peptide chain release factor 2 [Candidatus Cloacimonadota bacterium]